MQGSEFCQKPKWFFESYTHASYNHKEMNFAKNLESGRRFFSSKSLQRTQLSHFQTPDLEKLWNNEFL